MKSLYGSPQTNGRLQKYRVSVSKDGKEDSYYPQYQSYAYDAGKAGTAYTKDLTNPDGAVYVGEDATNVSTFDFKERLGEDKVSDIRFIKIELLDATEGDKLCEYVRVSEIKLYGNTSQSALSNLVEEYEQEINLYIKATRTPVENLLKQAKEMIAQGEAVSSEEVNHMINQLKEAHALLQRLCVNFMAEGKTLHSDVNGADKVIDGIEIDQTKPGGAKCWESPYQGGDSKMPQDLILVLDGYYILDKLLIVQDPAQVARQPEQYHVEVRKKGSSSYETVIGTVEGGDTIDKNGVVTTAQDTNSVFHMPESYQEEIKIADKVWIVGVKDLIYTGKNQTQKIHVYDGTRLLTEKKDYTVSYKNNRDAYILDRDGSDGQFNEKAPQVVIKMKGDYTGSQNIHFQILPIDISVSQKFTTAKIGGTTLFQDGKTCFEILVDSYQKNDRKGTAKVTIRGIGEFGGEKTVTFKIVQRNIQDEGNWWKEIMDKY